MWKCAVCKKLINGSKYVIFEGKRMHVACYWYYIKVKKNEETDIPIAISNDI